MSHLPSRLDNCKYSYSLSRKNPRGTAYIYFVMWLVSLQASINKSALIPMSNYARLFKSPKSVDKLFLFEESCRDCSILGFRFISIAQQG